MIKISILSPKLQEYQNSSGLLTLTVYFDIDTDPDTAEVQVNNRVSLALPELPDTVRSTGVKVEKRSASILMLIGINSPDGRYDELYLSNYVATQIKDVLGRVKGVGLVTIFGAKDFGMRVWLDPGRLKARGLTPDEVVNALREQNVQVAAGKIGEPPAPDGTNFEYTLTTLGRGGTSVGTALRSASRSKMPRRPKDSYDGK